MNQQLYAPLSTQITQQISIEQKILVEKFETLLRANLSRYDSYVNSSKIFTMYFSKSTLRRQVPCYEVDESAAFSPKHVELLDLFMSKICNHNVSLVSNEKWDDHRHSAIALKLVKTYEVPEELETEEIYFLDIEFIPVLPQFKLTASYFENFKNLASLSLYAYSFNEDVDVVSMFSKIPFLQFLFLKYCNIEYLQKILDTCIILQAIQLIHCDFHCENSIDFPELIQIIDIRHYETLRINILRCENNLKEIKLDTKFYHVEITSKSSNAKIIASDSSNIKIITPQSSNTKIITSQRPNLRELDLRCYLIDPICFGETLEYIDNLTLDGSAIYNYATIGSSTTKNLQDKSRLLALECIIWLKTFRVIHPSRKHNLSSTFHTTMFKEVSDDVAVKVILEWEDGIIQYITCRRRPMHLFWNPPFKLVVRRS